jgi:hypothetical protein
VIGNVQLANILRDAMAKMLWVCVWRCLISALANLTVAEWCWYVMTQFIHVSEPIKKNEMQKCFTRTFVFDGQLVTFRSSFAGINMPDAAIDQIE